MPGQPNPSALLVVFENREDPTETQMVAPTLIAFEERAQPVGIPIVSKGNGILRGGDFSNREVSLHLSKRTHYDRGRGGGRVFDSPTGPMGKGITPFRVSPDPRYRSK